MSVQRISAVDLARALSSPKAAPGAAAGKAAGGFAQVLESTRSASVAKATRTVARGDTLWKLCAEQLRAQGLAANHDAVDAAVQRVTKANGLRNANRLHIGQSLDLSAALPEQAAAPSVARGIGQPIAQPVSAIAKPLGGAYRAVDINTVIRSILHPEEIPLETSLSSARAALTPPVLDGPVNIEPPKSPWTALLDGEARLTSEFGVRRDPFTRGLAQHDGIDLAATPGTAIHPLEKGVVTYAGWKSGYGRMVIVEHENGLQTVYGHSSKLHVTEGDVVTPNDVIAEVGSTGRSTGAHLHFEVRRDGEAIDPMPFLTPQPALEVAETL